MSYFWAIGYGVLAMGYWFLYLLPITHRLLPIA